MSSDRREIVIPNQGKIVVVTTGKAVELGIESECCTCVAPVFQLNMDRLRAIRAAITDAIAHLVIKEASERDPIAEEAS